MIQGSSQINGEKWKQISLQEHFSLILEKTDTAISIMMIIRLVQYLFGKQHGFNLFLMGLSFVEQ